ncbi:MAG: hypothetical protein ACYC2I_04710 [Elusimicrobiales bacterium]
MERNDKISVAAAVLPALLALASGSCSEKRAAAPPSPGPAVFAAPSEPVPAAQAVKAAIPPGPAEECLRAGGKAKTIKECDGSESLWCDISPREACYADQVIAGRCTAGHYSEELKGITGITPRVLCDQGQ